jgi:hypothetical protein
VTERTLLSFDGQDEYEAYTHETRGYRYDAWESLTQGEIHSHDAFLHRTLPELEATRSDEGTTLDRWAVSRAWLAHGNPVACLASIRNLLTEEPLHPALDRGEIILMAAELSLTLRDFSATNSLLEKIAADHPCALTGKILRAVSAALEATEDEVEVLDTLRRDTSDDPESCFDVAALLLRFKLIVLGKSWLAWTREVANSTGKLAVLVDLELLEADYLPRLSTEE